MKKVMLFAAAMIASGAAFADIASANVVGYKVQAQTDGQFNSCVACFQSIGTQKLGDITAQNTTFGVSTLMFLNGGAGTRQYSDANFDNVDMSFTYMNAEEAGEFEVPAGWYLTADEDLENPMNDLEVPYGQAFLFKADDAGATLTFAGQVPTDETVVAMQDGVFNFVGNMIPVDLTLGDITAQNTTFGVSTLMFLNGGAGTRQYSDDNFNNVDMSFTYMNAEEAEEFEVPAGWYLTADEDLEHPMNDLPVPAGSAFLFKADDSGATLTFPAAL